jgi:hypothetical protein
LNPRPLDVAIVQTAIVNRLAPPEAAGVLSPRTSATSTARASFLGVSPRSQWAQLAGIAALCLLLGAAVVVLVTHFTAK